MHRLWERGFRLTATILVVLVDIAALAGYFGVGTPVKVGGIVLAIGIGIWAIDGERSQRRLKPPDPWKSALVASLALLAAFALAWKEARPPARSQFDFVVVPEREVAIEFLAPNPRTEIVPGPKHGYGEHLTVICYAQDRHSRVWYRLEANLNFMSEKVLLPAPLSDGSPPEC